ncbi:hypothetical protein VaNZ11_000966, partial [Volvox africanus]
GGDAAIREMDAQLPEGTILLFRRMAHAMAQSQKPAASTTITTTAAAAAAALTAASSTTDGAQGREQIRTPAAGGSGGGGWVGWLMGGKRPPAAAAPAAAAAATAETGATAPGGSGCCKAGDAAAAAATAPVSATLTPEEWDRLQQLLLQEDVEDVDAPSGDSGAQGDGGDGPYCPSALLEVAVERCSVELDAVRAGVAQPLISASMQAVGIRILRYPTTLGVSLRVGWAGVEAPDGVLLSTGQLSNSNGLNKQPPPAKLSNTGSRYGAAAAGDVATEEVARMRVKEPETQDKGGSRPGTPAIPTRGSAGGNSWGGDDDDEPTCAFMLDFVRHPQDGSADATLSVRLAPSYVTYNPAAVAAVGAFFSTEQHIGFENLQVQAAARLQRLQRVAQVRLRALSQERQRLAVQVVMHAPKVALLDDKGLTYGSNEASLYECFDLGLERVEAAIVGGRFAWPGTRPSLPAALEEVL